MFFLAVLTWATLTKEPPRIVQVLPTLEACQIKARQAQHSADSWAPSGVKFICLEAKGEA